MFPLCGLLLLLLCLQYEGLCRAFHTAQTHSLQVEYGQSAVLHCNGSAYKEEEGSVHWEVMGEDVAILQGGEPNLGERFQGRVQLPSEEQLREGDWSVVLHRAVLRDADMYECIWQGGKVISTVWLTVMEPHVERSITLHEGARMDLACFIQITRTPSNDLEVWWTRDGNTLASLKDGTEVFASGFPDSDSDTAVVSVTEEEFHLHMTPTMSDNGQYQCWYRTRRSDTPRLGLPESITLTVTNETDAAAEDGVDTSPWTQEVTDSPDFLPVVLQDPTQPMTGTPETPSESFHWDALPWIRIGLIGGVLLVTSVVLCVLGALRKI